MAQNENAKPNNHKGGKTYDPSKPSVQQLWLALAYSASLVQAFFEHHGHGGPVKVSNGTIIIIKTGGTYCKVRKFLAVNWNKEFCTEFVHFAYPTDNDERKREYLPLGTAEKTIAELNRLQELLDPMVAKAKALQKETTE